MATKAQIENLIALLDKRKTKRNLDLAEINIDGILRNKKIKNILIKNDELIIRTNRLYLHAPNGKKAYLGIFELTFIKELPNWWNIIVYNLNNERENRNHPHGSDCDLCISGQQETSINTQLSRGNIYIAIDRYIQILETFNLNDHLCIFAGLWFRNPPKPYLDITEAKRRLGRNEN